MAQPEFPTQTQTHLFQPEKKRVFFESKLKREKSDRGE